MDLKLTGTVDQILEEQSGTSQRGQWRKQDFVLEIPGEYPRKVCITVWGDNIDRFALKQGERVTASIDLSSREYNGRWYTDVKAWRLERAEDDGADPMPEPLPPLPESSEMDDELPF
ncbi:MAG: DUF3127 domain-containing protein [Rhodothermales bacterium]|nr:DUF3127 domain-containing protein [Rhodothermales bacterium]MBO6779313.1 DUF3127 domain-containing protein [Rhodothermales bacterium]